MFSAVPLFILLVGALAFLMWIPIVAALLLLPIACIYFYRLHRALSYSYGFGKASLMLLAIAGGVWFAGNYFMGLSNLGVVATSISAGALTAIGFRVAAMAFGGRRP